MVIIKTSTAQKNKFPVNQRCSIKKMFLEISQNSQENTCARVFFIYNTVAGLTASEIRRFLIYKRISKKDFTFLQSV